MQLRDLWYARNKTLIFRIPTHDWSRAEQYAHRLPNCQILNWREEALRNLRPGQQRLKVDAQTEIERLMGWTETRRGNLLAIVGTEYFLAKMEEPERDSFWHRLYHGMPHLSCVVVYLVINDRELLPGNLDAWEAENRMFTPGDMA